MLSPFLGSLLQILVAWSPRRVPQDVCSSSQQVSGDPPFVAAMYSKLIHILTGSIWLCFAATLVVWQRNTLQWIHLDRYHLEFVVALYSVVSLPWMRLCIRIQRASSLLLLVQQLAIKLEERTVEVDRCHKDSTVVRRQNVKLHRAQSLPSLMSLGLPHGPTLSANGIANKESRLSNIRKCM